MKASNPAPREPEQLEQIVSYLDGELSAEESARVERRLASDAEFRQELQSIDRVWAALDELPLTTVEDRFSKTTMEMVVQDARGEVAQKTRALPLQKRKRNLRDVLLVAAAVLLGGLVFRISWQNPNRPLLADLGVIQNVDIYTQFREVDFLRQLNRRVPTEAWSADFDPVAVSEEPIEFDAFSGSGEEWLEQLSEEDRFSLRAKYNRFRSLPAKRQEQLRQLDKEIRVAEDAEVLRQTMRLYQRWLGGLPASEQYELRELDATRRVERIMRMLQQHAREKSLELTPEELQAFFQHVKTRLEQERERILEKMSRRERERFVRLPGNEQRKELIRRLMRESRQGGKRFNNIVHELIPENKRAAFQQLSPEEKRRQFAGWMGKAVMHESGQRRRPGRHVGKAIPEQALEKYFTEELDAATIERLLALPREKMQQQLKRRYRGGVSPRDWEDLLGREHGGPRRHGPPRAGDGRRREMGRPRPHEWHRGRPGPAGERPPERRPFGGPGHDRDDPLPLEDA